MVVMLVVVGVQGDLEPGEFVAGSFILTQKALDEAPYRYSSFLTEVTTNYSHPPLPHKVRRFMKRKYDSTQQCSGYVTFGTDPDDQRIQLRKFIF
jgi:hypothetical protein